MFKRLKYGIAGLLALWHITTAYGRAETADGSIPPSYHWGRGISWPDANFNLGGYVNVLYKHPERLQDKFSLDQWSFFLTWSPHRRLRFFSEIEVDDWLSTVQVNSIEQSLKVERLYMDWLATESTTVRVGKYLTPVGRWNVIHAAPLMWTSTRPLVTKIGLFSPHLNGIMLTQKVQVGERNLDISVYADNSSQLDVLDKERGFDNAFGGRLNFELSEYLQLGASFINFEHEKLQVDELTPATEDAEELEQTVGIARDNLFGADLLWKQDGYEVAVEAIYRASDGYQGDEKGLYIQGVVPLTEQVFAVGRYEHLEGKHRYVPIATDIGIAGLAWRPYVPLAIKAEYRLGVGNEQVAPSGFFTSISMFF
jgi:hypothetical protein